ncbi:MAG: hypothetical protein VXY90_08730, partial [Pseudomonadota bacterium]|nr:hypothetical protein [Pseudomonadota bacterium]
GRPPDPSRPVRLRHVQDRSRDEALIPSSPSDPTHPVEPGAMMRMPAHPIRDGGGPPPKNPAPALGADGPDLLAELGLDAAEIADLRAKGIV